MSQDRQGTPLVRKSIGWCMVPGMPSDPPVAQAARSQGPQTPSITSAIVSDNGNSSYANLTHPAVISRIFRSVFGPERWATKAAQILGVSPQMVGMMARGDRKVPVRHWAVMRAYSDGRVVNLLAEARKRHAEVDKRYEKALVDLQRARVVLENRQKP